MPPKQPEQKKGIPPQIPQPGPQAGMDFSGMLKLGASWKYPVGAGAAGALVLFLFYLLKLASDVLLAKNTPLITALSYPIILILPILIGIGMGFGLKRFAPGAAVADGALAGLVAGIMGSALGGFLILLEIYLLGIPSPYYIGTGLLNIALLLLFSGVQTALFMIAASATTHFLRGG